MLTYLSAGFLHVPGPISHHGRFVRTWPVTVHTASCTCCMASGQWSLLFTPSPGVHSNGIQPIEKSPLGEGLDARPITELAGCRAASARHRVNCNQWSKD